MNRTGMRHRLRDQKTRVWKWLKREEKGGKGRKREEKGGKGRKREEKGGKGRKREEKGGKGRKRERFDICDLKKV
jgi:hypothetical protein